VRAKLGRPDLTRYAARFRVPQATPDTPLAVTFLGVATLLIDDGRSAIMTDGFFSRPGLLRVLTRPIAPDQKLIRQCLDRAGVTRLDAVLPVHTHYDHAFDSAVVAQLTGAALVGGRSAANVGRGHGLDEQRLIQPTPGEPVEVGAYTVTLIESRHCPPDRMPGEIEHPVRPPARASEYRCGEAWSIVVRHRATERTLVVQGSAGFVEGALADVRADVIYLGVGQLGLRPPGEIATYWHETVRAVAARRAVAIHWDDFFRPITRPLRANPYAADDLDVTMRILGGLAEHEGLDLVFPTVWQREDPWAGL
jgi:L-ascorbate metabolism protein UlaG (beta-lactamase superfamily)